MRQIDLDSRLDFMGITEATKATLRSTKPALDAALPEALDVLYADISDLDETSAMFEGREVMARARGAMERHWGRLLAGEIGEKYANDVNRIGYVHAEKDLKPRWYLGA